MADEQKGIVAAGFSLLWRRQRVLWWLFVVNFIFGALGALPATMTLRRALGHSLVGEKLTRGFDLGMLEELIRLPNVNLMRQSVPSYIMASLFLLFMLFVSGGILEAYRQDTRLSAAEFFGACGAFFWRFVRLAQTGIELAYAGASVLYARRLPELGDEERKAAVSAKESGSRSRRSARWPRSRRVRHAPPQHPVDTARGRGWVGAVLLEHLGT